MTILYICLPLLFFSLALNLYYFRKRRDPSGQSAAHEEIPATDALARTLLQRLNCQFETAENSDSRSYKFRYQSGHFILQPLPDMRKAHLKFLYVDECDLEKLDCIRNVCNDCNLHGKHLTVAYTLDPEEGKAYAHILGEVMLNTSVEAILPDMECRLQECFSMRNLFSSLMQDAEKESEKNGFCDPETERAHRQREIFLHNELEINYYEKKQLPRLNETERLTLGQLMDTFFKEKAGDPIQLEIVTHELNCLSEAEEIRNFDLLSPLIFGKGKNAAFIRNDATLVLTYLPTAHARPRTLHIALHKEGLTEETLYARLTVCLSATAPDCNSSLINSDNKATVYNFIAAYDRIPTEKLRNEFQYMWQDAQEKTDEGKTDELTEEQRLIQYCTYPDVAVNLYRGRSLMRQKRFYEALLHLENAQKVLNDSFHILHSSYKETFYELCHYIGLCYCHLGLYKLAYFYLDIAFVQNNIRYTEEYINCLVNSNDFRSLPLVSNLLEQVENKLEENIEEPDEKIRSFRNFLRRRKVSIYIRLNCLEPAEEMLKPMLDEPDSNDYALNELARIQRLRRENDLPS